MRKAPLRAPWAPDFLQSPVGGDPFERRAEEPDGFTPEQGVGVLKGTGAGGKPDMARPHGASGRSRATARPAMMGRRLAKKCGCGRARTGMHGDAVVGRGGVVNDRVSGAGAPLPGGTVVRLKHSCGMKIFGSRLFTSLAKARFARDAWRHREIPEMAGQQARRMAGEHWLSGVKPSWPSRYHGRAEASPLASDDPGHALAAVPGTERRRFQARRSCAIRRRGPRRRG